MADDTKKEEETSQEETSEATESQEASDAEETSEATETSEASTDEESSAEEAAEEASSDEVEASDGESGEDDDAGDSEASVDDVDDASDEDSDKDHGSEEEDGGSEDEADEVDSDEDEADREVAERDWSEEDEEDEAERDWSEEDEESEADVEIEHEEVRSGPVAGVAAYFDHPDHLLYAASETRESKFQEFDAYSPFPIHGMDDAMGLGRSWIPWVTFVAGCAGLITAMGLQFGIMGFDWPMVYGGKPFIAWPSFVPIMFELTVLFAGVTTGLVMLKAAGCFQKPFIIDTAITKDRFVLWISADDEHFTPIDAIEFCKGLNPSEIRTVRKDGER